MKIIINMTTEPDFEGPDDPHSSLMAGGYRSTEPRRLLIELLSSTDECLTVEELYLGAHGQNPKIGLATVYRTLSLLGRLGQIDRVDAGDGKARYELSERAGAVHHHHLICESCRRVRGYAEFSADELALMKRTEAAIEKRFGYRITGHAIYFHGLCPACIAGRKSSSTSMQPGETG